jgi:hypothetical protein
MKAAARSAATLHRTGNFKSRGQCGESGAISGSFLARGKASEMAASEEKMELSIIILFRKIV